MICKPMILHDVAAPHCCTKARNAHLNIQLGRCKTLSPCAFFSQKFSWRKGGVQIRIYKAKLTFHESEILNKILTIFHGHIRCLLTCCVSSQFLSRLCKGCMELLQTFGSVCFNTSLDKCWECLFQMSTVELNHQQ